MAARAGRVVGLGEVAGDDLVGHVTEAAIAAQDEAAELLEVRGQAPGFRACAASLGLPYMMVPTRRSGSSRGRLRRFPAGVDVVGEDVVAFVSSMNMVRLGDLRGSSLSRGVGGAGTGSCPGRRLLLARRVPVHQGGGTGGTRFQAGAGRPRGDAGESPARSGWKGRRSSQRSQGQGGEPVGRGGACAVFDPVPDGGKAFVRGVAGQEVGRPEVQGKRAQQVTSR